MNNQISINYAHCPYLISTVAFISSVLYIYCNTLTGRPWNPEYFTYMYQKAIKTAIPNFDTSLPAFSINQLFVTNRFVGYDRVGDANQVAVGLTTRILDDYTGAEKANATIGEIYYFHQPTVCLTPNCAQDPEAGQNVSPIAGNLTYNLTPHLSATASAAYDPAASGMQNEGLQLNYQPLPQHILVAGYNYVQNGDRLNGVTSGQQ